MILGWILGLTPEPFGHALYYHLSQYIIHLSVFQVCSNGTRVFVQRAIYQEFVDRLVKKTAALKVGDPMAEDTMVGATISEQQAQKVLGYVQDAKEQVGRAPFCLIS